MTHLLEIILLRVGIILAPSPKMERRFRRSLEKRMIGRTTKGIGKHATESQELRFEATVYQKQEKFETFVKLIAFYLPQFHPFPENDKWWGTGFTEWTNATKARPLFEGHHQPHLPTHFGFYDLRLPQVLEEQSKIAMEYGVGGFAYYFYWFKGKTLMEAPLIAMLQNQNVAMPFCLIWANESWTRRWSGAEHHALVRQEHSLEDSAEFFEHVKVYFKDDRYIKIDGRPLLVIYRSDLFANCSDHLSLWREMAKKAGYPGIYIVCAQVYGTVDPRLSGFDAAMQFPPHGLRTEDISDNMRGLESDFSGKIFDYVGAANGAIKSMNESYKVFPGTMLSWDNTARRGLSATIFARFDIETYKKWLASNVFRISGDERFSNDEKIVFVNAWNEWAEGAHLEPDAKFGFGYLNSTRNVMRDFVSENSDLLVPKLPKSRSADVAIIIHVHFDEAIEDILAGLKGFCETRYDVYVTATSIRVAQTLKEAIPRAFVKVVENRGRDVRPFLQTLKQISNLNYKAVCKIHGKVSRHRVDGAEWRKELIYSLCNDDAAAVILDNQRVGLACPKKYLKPHTEESTRANRYLVEKFGKHLGIEPWRGVFPAGSMFWFKPVALKRLLSLGDDCFELEEGLLDGTGAHAIERLIGATCLSEGYEIFGATDWNKPCRS